MLYQVIEDGEIAQSYAMPSPNKQYVISDDSLHTHNVTRSISGQGTMTKKGSITLDTFIPGGNIRISFNLRSSFTGYTVHGRIYKNGVAFGTSRSTSSTSYQVYTEDLNYKEGDIIQLYMACADPGRTAYSTVFEVLGVENVSVSYNPFTGSNS